MTAAINIFARVRENGETSYRREPLLARLVSRISTVGTAVIRTGLEFARCVRQYSESYYEFGKFIKHQPTR